MLRYLIVPICSTISDFCTWVDCHHVSPIDLDYQSWALGLGAHFTALFFHSLRTVGDLSGRIGGNAFDCGGQPDRAVD